MSNRLLSLYTPLNWAFLFFPPAGFFYVYLWLHTCVCVLYNNVKIVTVLTKEL